MLSTEIVKLLIRAIEQHGDRETYLDIDGTVAECTEMVYYQMPDTNPPESIFVLR
ncbi:hypothetical protein GCM10027343_14590 [Noviherbaspirillum agri]